MPEAPDAAPSPARPIVVDDPRFQGHRGPAGHPERPERLVAVARAVARREDEVVRRPPRAASDEELRLAHPPAHLAAVSAAVARAPAQLDADTFVSPDSLDVARLAAGASVDLARAVARGEAPSGFAAVRPPGHHAEADRAMGFCLFNNVAVAARALQREEDAERVLIVDWDVHHGNGTEAMFLEDPSVAYFSTHQHPFYPGSGAATEIGRGAGRGFTLNVPLPAGVGDTGYASVFERLLAPWARRFRPDLILVSAGYDAHWRDPLAGEALSVRGYADLARSVCALADELCAGRVVCALEGGYDLEVLTYAILATLRVLEDRDARPEDPFGKAPAPETAVGGLVEGIARLHGIPAL